MKVVVCTAAAAVAAGAALAVVPIAKPTPAGTLKAEIAAFNARAYAAAYTAYTPRFKAGCPFATFKKHLAAQRAQLPAGLTLSVKVTSTRIVGAKAYLGYGAVVSGSVVQTFKNDLFVRVHGLWYDEVDKNTTC